MGRIVRDDPFHPDPGFSDVYSRLPDEVELEPWLTWARNAGGRVLYLGCGAGRLAVPLARAGIDVLGVDSHPGMIQAIRRRAPWLTVVQGRIEELHLEERFPLVLAPSNILYTGDRVAGAVRHLQTGGKVALELVNPHWLSAGAGKGVRVLSLDRRRAEIEIDYPGGERQAAGFDLVWPEEAEEWLESNRLELELMRGAGGGGLSTSPSFYLLARRQSPSET